MITTNTRKEDGRLLRFWRASTANLASFILPTAYEMLSTSVAVTLFTYYDIFIGPSLTESFSTSVAVTSFDVRETITTQDITETIGVGVGITTFTYA